MTVIGKFIQGYIKFSAITTGSIISNGQKGWQVTLSEM
jgi:hypothetical protein